MPGSAFGVGAPITHAPQFSPWGVTPYGHQGLSITPHAWQQPYGQPFMSIPVGSTFAVNPYGAQPLQQVLQLLQVVPQQLQQLQQLEYLQQQQLHQLQQLLQLIPGQLLQLQHLIQFVPQQIQQMQQPSQLAQPFSQVSGPGSFAGASPWGIPPQIFGSQPGQVM